MAKKAAAFFSISRSIRRVFTSRFSAVSSSRSALVSAPVGPFPASTSACRTHARTDVSVEAQRNRLLLLGIMTAAGWDNYSKEWWHYHNGLGISIVSTPKGVMSDANARAANVGGEVLCTVF